MELVVCVFLVIMGYCESARILGIFPNPSVSHQMTFRPIMLELARRGHEVVTVTALPAFTNKTTPPNFTEISVQEVSHKINNDIVLQRKGDKKYFLDELRAILDITNLIMDHIVENTELKKVLQSDKKVDLIVVESYVRAAIAYSKILNAPVILVSSFGILPYQNDIFGNPTQPLIYPVVFQRRIYNLTYIEKLQSLLFQKEFENLILNSVADKEYGIVKKICGEHLRFDELYKNVKMVFLANNPIWADNQPNALSYQFIGGVHKTNEDSLPKDVKDYLDLSKNGVIYLSFGCNTNTSTLPKMGEILHVLSNLPYDILFKWDADFPVGYSNIFFFRWLPQGKILKHPKIKAFVTQGGLQSTDEAVLAGVPLVSIPIHADQFYNAEKYVKHKIGLKIDLSILTADNFKIAVETVINDSSYKNNVLKLRSILIDNPMTPIQTTVQWMEYVIRFGGDHLQPISAHISWLQYYEVELIVIIIICALFVIYVKLFLVKYFFKKIFC